MANLSFDTLEEAQEACNKLQRIAAAYHRLQGGKTDGTVIIDANGGRTEKWDTPELVNGKYEIKDFANDSRFSNIDFLNCKLGLPINSEGIESGEHDMISIEEKENLLAYKSDYFEIDEEGCCIYTVGDWGAFSATSNYARTEERELVNHIYTDNSENITKFSVLIGVDNTKVLVQQAHGENETLYILSYLMKDDGTGYLRAFVDEVEGQDPVAITIKENVKYGDITTIRAEFAENGSKFNLYLDYNVNCTVPDYSWNIGPRVNNDYWYWKRGAYWANNANKGNKCKVKRYPILIETKL
jgi:hypothetical protein